MYHNICVNNCNITKITGLQWSIRKSYEDGLLFLVVCAVKGYEGHILPLLGIKVTERDCVDWVVTAEEKSVGKHAMVRQDCIKFVSIKQNHKISTYHIFLQYIFH